MFSPDLLNGDSIMVRTARSSLELRPSVVLQASAGGTLSTTRTSQEIEEILLQHEASKAERFVKLYGTSDAKAKEMFARELKALRGGKALYAAAKLEKRIIDAQDRIQPSRTGA